MTTVLLVDDDQDFAATLAAGLRSQGFDVARTTSGEGAVEAIERDHPSIVLLDLGLPRLDGMGVLVYVRTWSLIPIVVISARADEPSKVAALQAGADDYVTKPFGIDELGARLEAVLRRGLRPDGRTVVSAGPFRIDLIGKRLTKGDVGVKLTATEWRLLEMLVGHEGDVVDHGELLRAVWGPQAATSVEYLRVYMAALRRKLSADLFVTVPGVGYRFQA